MLTTGRKGNKRPIPRKRITVQTKNGPKQVEAHIIYSLAVHKTLDQPESLFSTDYTVTHIPSGLMIWNMRSFTYAVQRAKKLTRNDERRALCAKKSFTETDKQQIADWIYD